MNISVALISLLLAIIGISLTVVATDLRPVLWYSPKNLVDEHKIQLTVHNEQLGPVNNVYLEITKCPSNYIDTKEECDELNIIDVTYYSNTPSMIILDQSSEERYLYYIPHFYSGESWLKFNITLDKQQKLPMWEEEIVFGGGDEIAVMHRKYLHVDDLYKIELGRFWSLPLTILLPASVVAAFIVIVLTTIIISRNLFSKKSGSESETITKAPGMNQDK